jgi:hypothetical protein
MFFRKIGKFLRGKATPFQIISATVLGALLGSLPGFSQGPLLLVVLLFLLIILNANLFIAGLTLLLLKLVSLILLPVYFNIGISLLEGPMGAPVAALANAPVTAWFGLEYYVMVPSLLVGGLTGLLLGIWLSRTLSAFRSKMASLESGSERFQAYTSKFWVKALAWLFVGGIKGKKSWEELNKKHIGLPVRPLGVVFVISLMVLGYVGFKLLDETIITSTVRDALEQVNGATVDIAGIEIKPAENRLVVSGLAMADPEALQTNRFASREIIADISGMNLLAKKVVIDSLQIREPMSGTPRKLVGRRTVDAPEPPEPAEGGDISIDEYLGAAKVWRERLETAKRLYDRIAPHMKSEEAQEGAEEMSWRERLAQQAREAGYAAVKSDSLIRESPRLWIREIDADNLVVGGSDDSYAISASNLATQPALISETGRINILRADKRLELTMELPSAEQPSRSQLQVRYSDLEISELEAQTGKDLPMEGGTMDISGEGSIDDGVLDLPLKVVLKNTTMIAFGSSLPMDNFPLEVRVYGPLNQPQLSIPKDAIEEAVKAGGKKKIEGLIKDKAGDKLKGILPFGG